MSIAKAVASSSNKASNRNHISKCTLFYGVFYKLKDRSCRN